MDAEEEERTVAVKLYLKGEKRTNICKDLNRSKGWLSKWVNRYKTGKEEWYKSQSMAPKNPGKKTKDEIENAVVNVRKTLMDGDEHESKYLGVGKEFISEYVWATICLGKQRLEIYYRAQDQDVAVLINEFEYDMNEDIKPLECDIWKIC